MSGPWRLSRRVLVVAPFIVPKHGPNVHPLLSRIDPDDYVILTTARGIAEGVAQGNPWLAARYVFCDAPAATRQTASAPRGPTSRRRAPRRLRRAALAVRENLAVLSRTIGFVRGGLRAVRESRCGLVLGMSDHGPAVIATWLVARLTRTPYVYYLVDLYRGNAMPWVARAAAALLEGVMWRGAERVVVSNAATAEHYRTRYGRRVALDVIHILTPDGAPLPAPARYDPRPPYTITYTGSIYWAHRQAVVNCLMAMERLADLPLQLRLYCPSADAELRALVAGRANVWLGSARRPEMARVHREATLLLVALAWHTRAPDIIATATPGKSVEYLAAGRPLLIHAPDYAYISRHARKHRLGLVVDRDDPAALAEAIRGFLRAPEVGREYVENARQMYRSRHDAGVAARQLVSILNGTPTRSDHATA